MKAPGTYDSAAAHALVQSLGDWCREHLGKRPSPAVLAEMLQLGATGQRDLPPQLALLRQDLPAAVLSKAEALVKAQQDLAGEIDHAVYRWRLENAMLRVEPSLRKTALRRNRKEKVNAA